MSDVLIGLVGDVLVNREQPAEVFRDVRDILATPDILFGNLEGAYTDDPHPVPGIIGCGGAPLRYMDAFGDFDVFSLANNHILDVGYEAMFDTQRRLTEMGIKDCGVGRNLAAAREPAILEAKGLRIAFLAYASVFPVGFPARFDAPGLAPMRAYNFYRDPYPTIHVPGKLPIVTTVPDETDWKNLEEDIRAARAKADIVVASFHWGDVTRPFVLSDHETRTARHCIDIGADMVVGHHHHLLRGMEWYKGKPILYGLSHFVFDLILPWGPEFEKGMADLLDKSFGENPYAVAPRPGWPYLPMHEDSRMTLIAWASAGRGGVSEISVLPCMLRPDGSVQAVGDSPERDQVLAYVAKCNATQRLNARIEKHPSFKVAGFETFRIMPAA